LPPLQDNDTDPPGVRFLILDDPVQLALGRIEHKRFDRSCLTAQFQIFTGEIFQIIVKPHGVFTVAQHSVNPIHWCSVPKTVRQSTDDFLRLWNAFLLLWSARKARRRLLRQPILQATHPNVYKMALGMKVIG
jgi:hypothetical protein